LLRINSELNLSENKLSVNRHVQFFEKKHRSSKNKYKLNPQSNTVILYQEIYVNHVDLSRKNMKAGVT